MRYHVILNACIGEYEKQVKEVNGFISRAGFELEQGNTIIICGGKQDGDDKQKLAEMAPTKSVIFIIMESYQAEKVLDFLENKVDVKDLYFFGSQYFAEELAVRLAKRLDGSSLTGGIYAAQRGGQVIAEKMVYSSHMKATFVMNRPPYCIAIAKGQAEGMCEATGVLQIETFDLRDKTSVEIAVTEKFEPWASGNGLNDTKFAVVIGRGIGKKEAAVRAQELAAGMKAAFGASRPVVMNAWSKVDTMVGVSGNMIKPKVCIAVAASGTPAFYAGIEKSEFIVAVNTDENAAIMKKADVAVVCDGKALLEELAKLMEAEV